MKKKTTKKKTAPKRTARARPAGKAGAKKKLVRKAGAKKKLAGKAGAKKKPAGKAGVKKKPAGKATKNGDGGARGAASGRAKAEKRTRGEATSKSHGAAGKRQPARSGETASKEQLQGRAPLIRKGLPVTKAALRRLGRMQQGERPKIKSIITYTSEQKPKNLYPRKIISPPFPSKCCTNANRMRVGKIYEELSRHYYYKVCKACGHAVKYYFNKETEFDTPRLRKYYEWKKSVFH